MPRPVLLIHGYSDRGDSFEVWRKALEAQGFNAQALRLCDYETLTNEVTIKDVAEALDRAINLALEPGEEFDAIVHSTGMLVIRSWLTIYGRSAKHRKARLKHLVALAPATYGSPLAHKGRSWLGSLFKGRKILGPDFLEAGDLILDGLELGGRFTWDLAHLDLFGGREYYGAGADTPYVFIFCGTDQFGGIHAVANEDGTDGTVRWAGCALNSRKVVLDLTCSDAEKDRHADTADSRFALGAVTNEDVDVCLIQGVHHGTILSEPPDRLVDLVAQALTVIDQEDYDLLRTRMTDVGYSARHKLERDGDEWQQFIVRCVDERGDPITDYNLQLVVAEDASYRETLADGRYELVDMDPHVYGADHSLRCFHVNISRVRSLLKPGGCRLLLRVLASTGSALITYIGYGLDNEVLGEDALGPCTACLDATAWVTDEQFKLFMPFTTTLMEIRINREPTTLGTSLMPRVFKIR